MTSLETDTIAFPLPGRTPLEELEALKLCAGILNIEIDIDFEGKEGCSRITVNIGRKVRTDLDQEIADRSLRLAPFLISCDIPDWNQNLGSSGRLRISAHDDPWLDAVDNNEDWLLERTIDTEALEDEIFDEEEMSLEM